MTRYGMGIDPGLASCGWAIVERETSGALHRIYSDTIKTKTTTPLEGRLEQIARALSHAWTLVPNDGPLVVAIERFEVGRQSSPKAIEGTLLVVGAARQLFRGHARLVRVCDWHRLLGVERGGGDEAVRRVVEAQLGKRTERRESKHARDAYALAMVALREDEIPY